MMTNCDELPNPHKDCLRHTLSQLILHYNDLRRLTVEIRDLQNEFQCHMEDLEVNRSHCATLCPDVVDEFTHKIHDIDQLRRCFEERIERAKKNREEILEAARGCLQQLNEQKCQFRKFHEDTVEYLKRYAIAATDPKVVRKCERDICDMHHRFVKEVMYIKRCENDMLPMLKQLKGPAYEEFCKCCSFVEYEWLPSGKNYPAIQEMATKIEETMGKTLRKAFALMHLHQPKDQHSFLATYLMHLEHHEELMREKLKYIQSLK